MADLIINIPSHGFQDNDSVYVSWLDEVFFVWARNSFAFKISTIIDGGDIVQFTGLVTEGFVRKGVVDNVVTVIPGSEVFPDDPLYKFVLIVSSSNISSGAFDYPIGTVTGNTQGELAAMSDNGRYLFKPDTIFPGYPLAGSFRSDILKCVFRKVTPANVVVLFN